MGYTPPWIELKKIAGGWSLTPPNVTSGDDLTIYANLTDAYPYVKLFGVSAVKIAHASGTSAGILADGTEYLTMSYATPDVLLTALAEKNIYLKTQGAGLVKFGTYTADATVTQAGYITVLDNAGATRYLSCITP